MSVLPRTGSKRPETPVIIRGHSSNSLELPAAWTTKSEDSGPGTKALSTFSQRSTQRGNHCQEPYTTAYRDPSTLRPLFIHSTNILSNSVLSGWPSHLHSRTWGVTSVYGTSHCSVHSNRHRLLLEWPESSRCAQDLSARGSENNDTKHRSHLPGKLTIPTVGTHSFGILIKHHFENG